MSEAIFETVRRPPVTMRRDRLVRTALIALPMLVAAVAVVTHLVVGRFWLDLEVYRQAGSALIHGRPVYGFAGHGEAGDPLPFTYPPFSALMFVPFAVIGTDAAIFGWTLVSVAALEVTIWLVLRTLGAESPRRNVLTLGSSSLALMVYPVTNNLLVGQVDLLLMALVVADLQGPARSRWRGVSIGVAAGIKITPAIFALYLLLTGRPKAALRAFVGFLATVALGFLVLPGDSRAYWSGLFLDGSRVTPDARTINNQSLLGAMARITAQPWPAHLWSLPVMAVAGLAGITIAAVASRRGLELTGILTCALTSLLISPVSWPHHWVWSVPLLLVPAWRGAVQRTAAIVLLPVFIATNSWMIVTSTKHDDSFRGAFLVFSNAYVIVGLVLLAWVAVYLWRRRPSRSTAPGRSRIVHAGSRRLPARFRPRG
ncbi:glycosyltransferase 87 family protein [Amycolatopsis pigmentata]|uniref:Glycosyltransferase 87 family protein n=1 Tax=Amycolatopsis pigmentata TaxID=450801 RepID=A0ABW5G6X3_9PSEU